MKTKKIKKLTKIIKEVGADSMSGHDERIAEALKSGSVLIRNITIAKTKINN